MHDLYYFTMRVIIKDRTACVHSQFLYNKNYVVLQEQALSIGILKYFLHYSCNKFCHLIGWNQVSKSLRKLTT